ncbi:MAG: DUF3052 family protein [Thermoanaerobaculia bacterium]|nr:DUF3052 family protein [Thermoanaerobaculia bacterium]
MARAGYSGTPLAKKLGIKPGHRVGLIAAPEGFEEQLEGLPEDAVLSRRAAGRFDVVVLFCRRRSELVRRFPKLAERLRRDGGLWVAWPKKSSGVATDLAFDSVQRTGLDAGLVDNKVCAVDETWSGLRFVYRLEDR